MADFVRIVLVVLLNLIAMVYSLRRKGLILIVSESVSAPGLKGRCCCWP
jgi:hypothetical protein